MTIKQQYQRARRNYLRRVRNQEKRGYIVDIISIPKKPTKASIRRLEKQTAREIQRHSDFQEFITGEIVDKPTKRLIAENQAFMRLTPEQQQASREIGTTDIDEIEHYLLPVSVGEVAIDIVEVIIQNWFDTIESGKFSATGDAKQDAYIVGELVSRTLELLDGASREERARFAWTIDNNPDMLGEYKYFNVRQFNADFNKIREAMQWAEDSEDYRDFIENLGIIESEG